MNTLPVTPPTPEDKPSSWEILLLICENFIREAEKALSELEVEGVQVSTFPARCGLPPITWKELKTAARTAGHKGPGLVLGGPCIHNLQPASPVETGLSLVHTPQCFEMVAGNTFIQSQVRQGAFLVTPGWLAHWRQWIRKSGFDQATARECFRESSKCVVLVDTDTDPSAKRNLRDFSRFVNRPASIVPMGIDVFKVFLHRSILIKRDAVSRQQSEMSERKHRQSQADFAMVLDLLSDLPKASSEKEAFEKTVSVFHMLFAPRTIVYGEFEKGEAPRIWRLSGNETSDHSRSGADRMKKALENDRVIYSEHGFMLRMASRENMIRGLDVRDITFPEYVDRYGQMARAVADVCGLAIDNARSYQKLKENENRLREMATTDSLTRVDNRAYCMEKMEHEIIRAARYGTEFTLLILDVDYFKEVNDTYGHPTGDAVLKDIAGVCVRALRENDLFGRIGGEEFAAGLVETDLAHGFSAAERIRKNIASHSFKGDDQAIKCTVSLGITAFAGPGDTLEQMLKRADEALYQAKEQGRNRVVSAPPPEKLSN